MYEPRLIDANKVEIGFDELCQSPYFKADVCAKRGAETLMDLCVRTDSHKPNTIDPETLPIVKELQKQVKDLQEQLFHLEYWSLDRKRVLESAAHDRAAVKVMRKRCEKTIADLRTELTFAKLQLKATPQFGRCKYCFKKLSCPFYKETKDDDGYCKWFAYMEGSDNE